MIRKMMLVALAAVFVASFGVRAEDKPPAAFDDDAFMKTVAIGGLYDVCLSDLVGSQTKNEDIRKLAAGIVADHIVAGTGLKSAAKEAGIELPTKLDDTYQKRYEAFKTYKGDDLDRDFVKVVVTRYTLGLVMFTQASKEAKSSTVKAFATKTLPRIQKHLEVAKKLDK